MTAGVLVLLFVVFQLWGTGLHEAKAQTSSPSELDAKLAATSTTSTSRTTSSSAPAGPTTTIPPKIARKADIAPQIGEPVGRIEIPKIHVNKIVVQGDSLEQLDRAPGHYPRTPFPGQAGNSAIAGHRTTYGAPFSNVDKLKPGDKIVITTIQGRFTYAVQKVFIVLPDAVWVLRTAKDHPNTLTLTACHPEARPLTSDHRAGGAPGHPGAPPRRPGRGHAHLPLGLARRRGHRREPPRRLGADDPVGPGVRGHLGGGLVRLAHLAAS